MPSIIDLHAKHRIDNDAPDFAEGDKVLQLKVFGKPGSALKGIIFSKFGESPCSNCTATANKMDEKSVEWCREHQEDLATELVRNAKAFPKRYVRLGAFFGDLFGVAKPRAKELIVMACDLSENEAVKDVLVGFTYKKT